MKILNALAALAIFLCAIVPADAAPSYSGSSSYTPMQTPGTYLRTNSGVNRGVIPPAIASAPTITQYTSTQFSGAQSVSYNDARLLLANATWWQVGANPRAKPITTCQDGSIGCTASVNNGVEGNSGSIFFNSDCATCEIQFLYSFTRIYVDQHDGLGWQDLGLQTSGNSGTMYYLNVAFGSSKPRAWRIDCDLSCQFAGINLAKTGTVWAYVSPNPQSAIVMGDSFCEGTGADSTVDSYVNRLGFKLGIDFMYASCLGGTGVVKTNGSTVNYMQRIASLLASTPCPTFFFLQNSQNDNSFTAGQIETNEQSIITSVKAACPATYVVLIGIWNTTGTSTSGAANNAALSAWAASNGYIWIDWYSFITGTGKQGSTTGDGNADFYVWTDGTHPSTAGHTYRANRLGDVMRVVLYPLLSRNGDGFWKFANDNLAYERLGRRAA